MKGKSHKEFVVYRIYHIDTGKSYIGITGNYKKRIKDHFCSKNNCYIHNAIQKYGKDKFAYEIIFECDSWEELCKEEIEYIKVFDTKIPNGYNMTDGGEGVLGFRFSKEDCKKMSESLKGSECAKEALKKVHEANKGRIVSKETRKKISKANKGQKRSEKIRKKMFLAQQNVSKETRKKLSEAQKGFSNNQVLEIRKMLLDGIFQQKIAKKFGVVQSTIGCIKRNEHYADIQLPEN